MAMEQSAKDSGCRPEDFLREENRVVLSPRHPEARADLEAPFSFDLTSFGRNVVACVSPPLRELAQTFLSRFSAGQCFEPPAVQELMAQLPAHGQTIGLMAEHFLPDLSILRPLPCALNTRLLWSDDLAPLYGAGWDNALCEKRKHLDRLAVGAYHRGRLVGLAGCSADSSELWQIGVDVLPGYRRQGIASALTSQLALAVLENNRVPFYRCAWFNLQSARTALKSGFKPAWVQMTAQPIRSTV